ncbi:amidohydrolase [Candidatus Soleaferrea massiliensis]|uniref:amidohydrolase n=1 Tax=Candidatus Soleaferrea massiliensis TaxID=1470354 RepID=UPI00058E9EFC|nr:amidohydrolase [Candidatus Soleaferrea massiliensis]
MLFIHANILTMEELDIPDGYIFIRDGKIAQIGEMEAVPDTDEEILDLEGRTVVPGFVDAHCHLGMWEDALGFEGEDGNEDTDPSTPHLRAIDAVNPLDRCFSDALDAGVTAVLTGPGSANPVAGEIVAMKTCGRCVDDMILKAPAAIKFALGENPKSTYSHKNMPPVTRMATAAIIREQLYKAEKYLDFTLRAQADEDEDPPEYDIKCEALIPLLNGEIKAHFHAHRADDICTAIRLAKEFEIGYVIIHGTEGHLIPDILKREQADVVVGPILTDRSKPELKNQTTANAARLTEAGVRTAICTDHPEVPIHYLPLSAMVAAREGMSGEEALRALTILPAQICGIDGRVGSIAPGKDADLLVFENAVFGIDAKPWMVLVDGKIVRGRIDGKDEGNERT